LSDLDGGDRQQIFDAYISALGEDADVYRADAAQVMEWAQECSTPEDLKPDSSGLQVGSFAFSARDRRLHGLACRTFSALLPKLCSKLAQLISICRCITEVVQMQRASSVCVAEGSCGLPGLLLASRFSQKASHPVQPNALSRSVFHQQYHNGKLKSGCAEGAAASRMAVVFHLLRDLVPISSVFGSFIRDFHLNKGAVENIQQVAISLRCHMHKVGVFAGLASYFSSLLAPNVCMQIQKLLADVKDRVDADSFYYTRFFGIGLFRCLEITEARDPKALEGVVSVRCGHDIPCIRVD
jgi:hypothetical protein